MTSPNNPPNTRPVLTRSPSRAGFNIEHTARRFGAYMRAVIIMTWWLVLATVAGSAAFLIIRLAIWSLVLVQKSLGM